MVGFLSKLGESKLSAYLKDHETTSLTQVLKLIEKDISGKSILLTFDNYYQPEEDVVEAEFEEVKDEAK